MTTYSSTTSQSEPGTKETIQLWFIREYEFEARTQDFRRRRGEVVGDYERETDRPRNARLGFPYIPKTLVFQPFYPLPRFSIVLVLLS